MNSDALLVAKQALAAEEKQAIEGRGLGQVATRLLDVASATAATATAGALERIADALEELVGCHGDE